MSIPKNKTWFPVAPAKSFNLNKPQVLSAKNRLIAVYKLEDGFYAIEDQCSHQNLPLSEGPCEKGIVECPFHGAQFCIKTGKVLSPPAYTDLETFEARANKEGMVEVCV